ncbi:hypothetical protein pdam_00024715 [Pocillopora damicornis]|uniref:DDE Tnp4 domain-containing protein n=1 Tax=Pocillopora damicornis TaxID=46731 RepID=A0A3M6TL76_POCDA|nr:hypothetical protein pdam_00024715 [Pocillopora damicornis]
MTAAKRKEIQNQHSVRNQRFHRQRTACSEGFLQVIGDTSVVDKSTVSRAITDVSRALTAKQPYFIKWPLTHDECMFTDVVTRWPGRSHESHIFRTSNICTYLQNNHRSPDNGALLGDSGYTCSPFLMTPFATTTTPS